MKFPRSTQPDRFFGIDVSFDHILVKKEEQTPRITGLSRAHERSRIPLIGGGWPISTGTGGQFQPESTS